jgi:BirA family biotin operon repressor/biotin-[acetyl-CoA-carboxylase] ligase
MVKHAAKSHFDVLKNLCKENISLPHALLCLAGSGDKFHGFKNRPWVSLPGNIHLVAYLSPNQPVTNYGAGFIILTAVSVVQAIDDINDLKGKAGIKWINDVLINNHKICGVLAYSQSEGDNITGAVLGIGLNVEKAPLIESTPFVPRIACLKELSNSEACTKDYIFGRLLYHLNHNYQLLIEGQFNELLEFYRKRSLIIGRKVEIHHDSPKSHKADIITGTVDGIGENLELFLEGEREPISDGRLVLLGQSK